MQASDPSECGQCLSLAWMPTRPHHHLAAGYYNGKKKEQREHKGLLLFKLYVCLFFGCFLFGSVLGIMFKQCKKKKTKKKSGASGWLIRLDVCLWLGS